MANLTNEKGEFAIAIFRNLSPLAPLFTPITILWIEIIGGRKYGFFGNPHKNESRRGSEDERFRGPGQEERNIGGEIGGKWQRRRRE